MRVIGRRGCVQKWSREGKSVWCWEEGCKSDMSSTYAPPPQGTGASIVCGTEEAFLVNNVLFVVFKATECIIGLVLACQTRKIKLKGLRESSQVALASYIFALHSHCVCGGPVPDKTEPNVHRVAACGRDTSVGVVSSHTHCYFHSKGTYKGGIFSKLSVCLLKAAVWAWFKVVAQHIA